MATTRVYVVHILLALQLLVFLILTVGGEYSTWRLNFLDATTLGYSLADGSLAGLWHKPWTVLTFPFVHTHHLALLISAGALLLAGPAIERCVGAWNTLGIYFLSALGTAVVHVVLQQAGVTPGQALLGSLGPSGGLLTAYLLVFGNSKEVIPSLPYPVFYCFLVAGLAVVCFTMQKEGTAKAERTQASYLAAQADLERLLAEYQAAEALARTSDAAKPRAQEAYAAWEAQEALTLPLRQMALVTHHSQADRISHLTGVLWGGLALLTLVFVQRARERHRINREIHAWQTEVEARERVEVLLEKISQVGMDGLSAGERKFLVSASNYYKPRLGAAPRA